MADGAGTTVTVIAVVLGVVAVSALVYFVAKPKTPQLVNPGGGVPVGGTTNNPYQNQPTTGGGTGAAPATNKWDFLTGLTNVVGGVANRYLFNNNSAGTTAFTNGDDSKTVVFG